MTQRARIASEAEALLIYLRKKGEATVREVAVEVFQGSGATRTSTRGNAYTALRRLENRGLVQRRRPEQYTRDSGDLWSLAESARDSTKA